MGKLAFRSESRFSVEILAHLQSAVIFLQEKDGSASFCRPVSTKQNSPLVVVFGKSSDKQHEKRVVFNLKSTIPNKSLTILRELDDALEVKVINFVIPSAIEGKVNSFSESKLENVHFRCSQCFYQITKGTISRFKPLPPSHWQELSEEWFCGSCCGSDKGYKLVKRLHQSLSLTQSSCLFGASTFVLSSEDLNFNFPFSSKEDETQETEPILEKTHESHEAQSSSCCGEKSMESGALFFNEPPNLIPGEGNWIPLLCKCERPIGAYYVSNSHSLRKPEVHILKHKVKFLGEERHTVESVLVERLLTAKESSGNFRFLLRCLETGKPYVVISILNSEALASWGECEQQYVPSEFEDSKLFSGSTEPVHWADVDFYKVLKVIYFTSENQDLEKFSENHFPEDLFILNFEWPEIEECLNTANKRMPDSVNMFNGHKLAWLRIGV